MNQGPSQQNGNAEDVTSKKFVDADESQKTAILNEMFTVMDMEKILPDDLKEWDKQTTSLVLEKAFNLCGLSRTTEERSKEEVKTEQERLKLQLDALREKKAENAALLMRHRLVEHKRHRYSEFLERDRSLLAENNNILDQLREIGLVAPSIEKLVEILREDIASVENFLEELQSPLRN